MWIKIVHLISFGKFTNREISFDDEISVIFGHNEAGKTTVVDAMAGVLFGFRGRREEIRKLKMRYTPWRDNHLFLAGLTVSVTELGELYIERDFNTNRAEIYKVTDAGKTPAQITAEEIVRKYLGVTDLQLFKSTMLIRQEEIAQLAREEVANALSRKIISSGQASSIKSIFNTLGKKYLELNKGLLRNTGARGLIKTCLDEIDALETELKEIDGLAGDYEKFLKEEETLAERAFMLTARLAEITPQTAGYRKQQEYREKRDQLFDRQRDIQVMLDKVKGMNEEIKKIDRFLLENEPVGHYFTDAAMRMVTNLERNIESLNEKQVFAGKNLEHFTLLKEQLERDLADELQQNDVTTCYRYSLDNLIQAERLSGQILEMERELAAKQADTGETNTPVHRRKGRNLALKAAGLLLCILSPVGLLAPNMQGYALASLVFFTGLTILLLGLAGKKTGAGSNAESMIRAEQERIRLTLDNYRKMLGNLTGNIDMERFRIKVNTLEESRKKVFAIRKQLAEINIDRYQKEYCSLQDELDKKRLELAEFLAGVGLSTPEEYRRLGQTIHELTKERDILRASVRQYLGDAEIEELSKEISVLSVKIHNLQTEMNLLGCRLPEEEYELLAEEETARRDQLDALEKELIRIRTVIGNYRQLAFKDRDRWTLETRLAEKKVELKALELKKKGILETVKILREAVREAQVDIVPMIVERASKLFADITDGRYQSMELSLDAGTMTVSAAGEGGQSVDAGFLSTGTRDQLYLALRVAMAEFFAGGSSCPLIFDDPCVNFDTDRLFNTVDLLKRISSEHQIIILTKDPSYFREHADIASCLEI